MFKIKTKRNRKFHVNWGGEEKEEGRTGCGWRQVVGYSISNKKFQFKSKIKPG